MQKYQAYFVSDQFLYQPEIASIGPILGIQYHIYFRGGKEPLPEKLEE